MEAPQAFMYASEPQAVPTKRTRAKYREGGEGETDDLTLSNNIMFDRRVVRGNTYAAQVRLGTPVGVGGMGSRGSAGALSVGRLERPALDAAAAAAVAVRQGSSQWRRRRSLALVWRGRARPSDLRDFLRSRPWTTVAATAGLVTTTPPLPRATAITATTDDPTTPSSPRSPPVLTASLALPPSLRS